MTWFPDPIVARIYCTFKERSMADLEIPQDTYEQIRGLHYHNPVMIQDKSGRILFDGKRWEITGFKHVYPEKKGIDTYTMNSHVYGLEKIRRDAFWAKHKPTMTKEMTEETWSIIYARWGKSYQAWCEKGNRMAWKSFFRGMFQIVALELAGYRDKISAPKWIVAIWIDNLEIPDVYWNLPLYNQLINGKEILVSELPEGSAKNQA